MASINPQLSVITTMYKSGAFVKEFYERILNSLNKLGVTYEIIFVNDGSPDDSLEQARKIANVNGNVRVIDLSRNFGHHNAMFAGLNDTIGERVFLIDIDLEEPPELLLDFWSDFDNDDSIDSVYGISSARDGGIARKKLGSLFYVIFNRLSDTKIPENLLTIRLMSRRYVDALMAYKEESLFLGGLFANVGFKQIPREVQKVYKGNSTYSIGKRIQLLVTALASFSSKPLSFFVYFGALISVLSALAVFYVLVQKLIFGTSVAGWASVMLLVSFFGGLQVLAIGVIGTYLGKVFDEVKRRPRFIVKDVFREANIPSVTENIANQENKLTK